ncbi:hypothetical protein M569_07071 [Genlisea aurea]|uniref:Uncharacterized protein n=1 Tax=Genlisea aurea TaxID=192259 RepID=S8CKI4_9LAMI|nr:hypothetical protein M569_07071 [Genlisea aurea]
MSTGNTIAPKHGAVNLCIVRCRIWNYPMNRSSQSENVVDLSDRIESGRRYDEYHKEFFNGALCRRKFLSQAENRSSISGFFPDIGKHLIGRKMLLRRR